MLSLRLDANCQGTTMVFETAPTPECTEHCLALCYECPVITECIALMAKQGDKYKYQVRGGEAVWITGLPWSDEKCDILESTEESP